METGAGTKAALMVVGAWVGSGAVVVAMAEAVRAAVTVVAAMEGEGAAAAARAAAARAAMLGAETVAAGREVAMAAGKEMSMVVAVLVVAMAETKEV